MATGDMPVDLLWDVVSKTALVLAALYGVLWAIRRFSGKAPTAHRGTSILLMQSAHLGPGRSVHLIGVGDRVLLVGATSQQVSLLADLGAAEAECPTEDQAGSEPFQRYLRQAADAAASVPGRLRRRREDGGGQT